MMLRQRAIATLSSAAVLLATGPGVLSAQESLAVQETSSSREAFPFARGQIGFSVYGWEDSGEALQLQIGHHWSNGIELALGADVRYSRGGPRLCLDDHGCTHGPDVFSEVELWQASLELRSYVAGSDGPLRPQAGFQIGYLRRVEGGSAGGFGFGPLLGLEWNVGRATALSLTSRFDVLHVADDTPGHLIGTIEDINVTLGLWAGLRVRL